MSSPWARCAARAEVLTLSMLTAPLPVMLQTSTLAPPLPPRPMASVPVASVDSSAQARRAKGRRRAARCMGAPFGAGDAGQVPVAGPTGIPRISHTSPHTPSEIPREPANEDSSRPIRCGRWSGPPGRGTGRPMSDTPGPLTLADLPHTELRSRRSGQAYSRSAIASSHWGLRGLFVHHDVVPPGRAMSGPHRHAAADELVVVLEGEVVAAAGVVPTVVRSAARSSGGVSARMSPPSSPLTGPRLPGISSPPHGPVGQRRRRVRPAVRGSIALALHPNAGAPPRRGGGGGARSRPSAQRRTSAAPPAPRALALCIRSIISASSFSPGRLDFLAKRARASRSISAAWGEPRRTSAKVAAE